MKSLAIATLIIAVSIIAGCMADRLFDAPLWIAACVGMIVCIASTFAAVWPEKRKRKFTPDEISRFYECDYEFDIDLMLKNRSSPRPFQKFTIVTDANGKIKEGPTLLCEKEADEAKMRLMPQKQRTTQITPDQIRGMLQ